MTARFLLDHQAELNSHLAEFRSYLAACNSHVAQFRTHLAESSSHLSELSCHFKDSSNCGNAAFFLKNAWHFKDIFREIEAFLK
jgi:hypothetical protein